MENIMQGYGLSLQQKRLLGMPGIEQHCTTSSVYIVDKTIDSKVFESQFQQLLTEHEIVRSGIKLAGPGREGVQFISDEVKLSVTLGEPFLTIPDAAGIDEIMCVKKSITECDVSVIFYPIADKYTLVAIYASSLFLDPESINYLFNQYLERMGSSVIPAQEVLEYADYSEWVYELKAQDGAAVGQAFWERQPWHTLSSSLLPWDKAANTQSLVIANIHASIHPELLQSLRELAEKWQLATDDICLAAWQVLLAKLGGHSTVAVGVRTSGRNIEELACAVGRYSASLPLFLTVQPHQRIVDFIQNSKAARNELLTWFEYFTGCDQGPEYSPYGYSYYSLCELNSDSFKSRLLSQRDASEYHHLQLIVQEQELQCGLTIQFDNGRYERKAAELLSQQYIKLLSQIAILGDVEIAGISCLTDFEREKLLYEFNPPENHFEFAPLHTLFEHHAIHNANNTAIRFKGAEITYQHLNSQANQLAHYFLQEGIEREDIIAICLERTPNLLVAALAVMKAGGVYVFLDPEYPAQRLKYMVENLAPSLVISAKNISALPAATLNLLDINELLETVSDQPTLNPAIHILPSQLAYILYTSGSTGKSKGVMISHQGLSNYLLWASKRYQVAAGSGAPVHSSVAFDATITSLFTPLICGKSIELLSEHDAVGSLQEALSANKHYSLVKITPAHMDVLATYDLAALTNGSKYYVIGGEALRGSTIDLWRQALPDACFINEYGPTETVVGCSIYEVSTTEPLADYIPIGCPIDNTQMYILDNRMELVPMGAVGEIYIAGAGVARGYYNNPRISAEVFVPNPYSKEPGARLYKTGDLGRFRLDGNMEFVGRIDDQVKIRGYRIELGEIEVQLLQLPPVREAAVIIHTINANDRRLIAYITINEVGNDVLSEIKLALGEVLPNYMVPAHIVILDRLPLTENGKVDRNKLKQLPLSEVGEYVAPRNFVEAKLEKIWASVLNRERVSINANFFALGGHSLLAAQLVAKLQQAEFPAVTLSDLFNSPTIEDLSLHIQACVATGSGASKNQLPILVTHNDERFKEFPLTDVQYAYWIGRTDAYEMGNIASYAYFERDVRDLDIEKFRRVWNQLIQRHYMLRMVVSADGRQRILEHVPPLDIPYIDLSNHENEQAYLMSLREQMSHQVLPTDTWPLFDIRVSHLSNGLSRVHLGMDALVTDAWSAQILIKELLTIYQNEAAQLPAIDVNFRDYVLAIEQLKLSELYQQSRRYWLNRMSTLPAAPNLPVLQSATEIEKPKFFRREFILPKQQWASLQRHAVKANVTASVVLVCAYAKTLANWCSNKHFTLNLTLFNRLPIHDQVNHLIGDFTSLTLLEFDFRSPQTFMETCQRTQQQLWQDLEHKYFTGVEVIRELIKIKGSTQAMMPVVFTSALAFESSEELRRLKNLIDDSAAFSITQTPQVWLDHQVMEQNGNLILTWDGVEGLFPTTMLDDMFATYHQLVESLALDVNTWQQNYLDLLPQAQRILREHPGEKTLQTKRGLLHDEFMDRAQSWPDNLAVVEGDDTFSYAELRVLAENLAQELRAKGAAPNELVAVVMEKGWEQIAAVLGVSLSGAAYLPIDAALPENRIKLLLAQADVKIVITQPALVDSLAWAKGLDLIALTRDFVVAGFAEHANVQSEADLAYVIFTSGSTGEPKGVMIDHRGAVNTIRDINKRFNLVSTDKVLALSALNFDLSVYDIFGMLSVGGCIVLPPRENSNSPLIWLELINKYNVTIWNSVPALMQMLVSCLETPVASTLRLSLLSGDWIPISLPEDIRKQLGCTQVISLGGATEASIWSIYFPIGAIESAWKSIPYGKPLSNQQVYVLDSLFQPCPNGVEGDIYIAGIGITKGYWKDEEKTRKSLIVHPQTAEILYRTGDMGRYLPDGNIEFLGRIDGQVKVQGFRIELGEIETALGKFPGLKQVILDVHGELEHRFLVAYLVPQENGYRVAHDILQEYLAGLLPKYMIPAAYIYLNEIPLTANGKIDKKALPKPTDIVQVSDEFIAPRNATEDALAEIWHDVLFSEHATESVNIGVNDNFFRLGGNSLLVMQIAAKIRDRLGKSVSPGLLLRNPTIAGTALLLAGIESTTAEKIFLNGITNLRSEHDTKYQHPASAAIAYPLSLAQQSLWFLSNLEKGRVVYNTPISVRLQGRLDMDLLASAIHELVVVQESLRTTFPLMDDEPVQLVHPVRLEDVSVQVIHAETHATIEYLLEKMILEDTEYHFDLEKGPLFKARIVSFGHSEYALLINMHHLINDHISIEIILHQIFSFYQATLMQAPITMNRPKLQYADYSLWQKHYLKQENIEAQLHYWCKELGGLEQLKLPVDFTESTAHSFDGDIYSFTLPLSLRDKLQAIADTEQTTLFNVVLSSYYVFLSYLCEQTDIVIGTPVSTRTHTEFEGTIGLFLNTLTLRLNVDLSKSFKELIQIVKEKSVTAINYIDVPSEKILAAIRNQGDTEVESLYQARFVFRNNQQQSFTLPDLQISALEEKRTTSKFDFMLTINDVETGLLGNIEYSSLLFRHETIQNLVQVFKDVVEILLCEPDISLAGIATLLADRETIRSRALKETHSRSRSLGLQALKNSTIKADEKMEKV